MRIEAGTAESFEYEVRDAVGRMIGGVLSYDTETSEAYMYLFDNKGKPVLTTTGVLKAKVILEGSYAYHRPTKKICLK